jgi:divalent metal cation (Fe/Co/Zn/Cd) transporter
MDHLNKKVAKIVKNFPEIVDIHGLDIRRINDKLALSLHCVMRGSDTVQASHEVAERLEYLLKNELKEIERVTIHIEPTDD